MRLITLDIETSPATCYTWGLHKVYIQPGQIIEPTRVLCWAAKWHGEKKVRFASEHHHGREFMVDQLWDLLDEADAVITYNGVSFDQPHVNREFLLESLGPPSPYASIDLYRTVRSRFRFMSNKLDSITKSLDIGGKAHHEGFDLWKKCLAGDDKAWGRMKRYNIQDVKITEALYDELRPWIRNHPSVNVTSGVSHACPTCGSDDLQKRGVARTQTSVYQRYVCNDCSSYSRGGERLAAVDVRPC